MTHEESTHDKDLHPGHEPLTISVKAVALGTLGLVLLIVITIWAMRPLSRLLAPQHAVDSVGALPGLPRGAPQRTVGVNPDQAEDRVERMNEQEVWLAQYAWVDQQQVARIPIERAMEIFKDQELAAMRESAGEPAQQGDRQAAESVP